MLDQRIKPLAFGGARFSEVETRGLYERYQRESAVAQKSSPLELGLESTSIQMK